MQPTSFMVTTTIPTPSTSTASIYHSTYQPTLTGGATSTHSHITHTISTWISSPIVQGIGAALLTLGTIKALQYLGNRNHRSVASSIVSSSSSGVPRGSSRSTNPYETPTQLHEYLLMHYALPSTLLSHSDVPDIPWSSLHFPAECARECIAVLKHSNFPADTSFRVLDVGCAVGRSSFELARYAHTVIGLDFSHSFIAAANTLRQQGEMEYIIKVEGDITHKAIAKINPAIDRSRVTFVQGDACALPSDLQPVHLVLAANLLCRLPIPRAFLAALPALIIKGGYAVFLSPYTWLTDYTNKDEWLGGYYNQQGQAVHSADNVKQIMEQNNQFKLISQKNVPFFIRETARKHQWSISHLTVFQRTPVD